MFKGIWAAGTPAKTELYLICSLMLVLWTRGFGERLGLFILLISEPWVQPLSLSCPESREQVEGLLCLSLNRSLASEQTLGSRGSQSKGCESPLRPHDPQPRVSPHGHLPAPHPEDIPRPAA